MRLRAPGAAALMALLLQGCFPFGDSIRKDAKAFLVSHPDGLHSLQVDGHAQGYAAAGDPGKPLVVLIHGSPGSWDAFASYLQDPDLTCCARVVAVDRPGFGASEPGLPLPSLQAQGDRIAAVLRAEGAGRPAVVLGHSLGGPVAARLCMDHPELVRGLVLVAPSIDPDLERTKWIQVPAQWGWVRALIPGPLDVCNQEILPLKGELRLMLPLWKGVRVPVRVLQGLDDDLVPPGNADFAERMLPPGLLTVTRIPGMNHFIPWSRPDLLKGALLELLALPPQAAPGAAGRP